jgi:predicted peptidase
MLLKSMLKSFLIVLAWACAASQAAEFEARVFRSPDGQTMPYRLYKPRAASAGKPLPLVLFLHGAGERGDNNSSQMGNGATLFAEEKNQRQFPCFEVIPQCPPGQQWVDMSWGDDSGKQPKQASHALQSALAILDGVEKEFAIDRQRIYVVGLSMGGYGVWDAISRQPKRFAAGVPICGGGDPAAIRPAARVPVWAFHSSDDPVVKVRRSREMVDAMRAAGGEPRYTEFKNVGHGAWGPALADPKLLPWLFAQHRGR